MKLKNKIAIVTGGSRGIGACISKRLASEGAIVVVVARSRKSEADALVDTIKSDGGQAHVHMIDLSTPANCQKLVDQVVEELGRVDILVNNAGIFTPTPIEETTEEIWDQQLDINLKSVFFLSKAAIADMKTRKSGKIINVTSIAGVGGFPNSAAYCASKGGLVNMTKAMCLEVAKFGINVNAVAPGNIKTEINADLRKVEGYDEKNASLTPNGVGHLDPEELTGSVVFLASDDANSIHGVNLLVDGGWAAW
ncbi:SDR family NAD(P)-dependent oxidoreductase [Sneathiella sp. HT1-7]|uniref:SDR family NAD(P)-dependent oxidoreductase n=1 Tax=Sneathiella sp. HT1-7 TaxID=2887192 RepID=UPI001D15C642|nr:3-oxoacyl-ACP reductase family protein [Sneathiella sp. HT1-7]MCC3305132.1 3-oxoacyl-ACP reductase FabG [Sneathiella sp. HT1-7]